MLTSKIAVDKTLVGSKDEIANQIVRIIYMLGEETFLIEVLSDQSNSSRSDLNNQRISKKDFTDWIANIFGDSVSNRDTGFEGKVATFSIIYPQYRYRGEITLADFPSCTIHSLPYLMENNGLTYANFADGIKNTIIDSVTWYGTVHLNLLAAFLGEFSSSHSGIDRYKIRTSLSRLELQQTLSRLSAEICKYQNKVYSLFLSNDASTSINATILDALFAPASSVIVNPEIEQDCFDFLRYIYETVPDLYVALNRIGIPQTR